MTEITQSSRTHIYVQPMVPNSFQPLPYLLFLFPPKAHLPSFPFSSYLFAPPCTRSLDFQRLLLFLCVPSSLSRHLIRFPPAFCACAYISVFFPPSPPHELHVGGRYVRVSTHCVSTVDDNVMPLCSDELLDKPFGNNGLLSWKHRRQGALCFLSISSLESFSPLRSISHFALPFFPAQVSGRSFSCDIRPFFFTRRDGRKPGFGPCSYQSFPSGVSANFELVFNMSLRHDNERTADATLRFAQPFPSDRKETPPFRR